VAVAAGGETERWRRAIVWLRRLIGHPWTRMTRAWLRDAWWNVRGLAVRNPGVPAPPRRLLFVCKGNICRSPFAARAAAGRLREAGRSEVECLSAGFKVTRETESPVQAREASTRFGVSLENHRSTQLDRDLMKTADAVVVMEASHLALLRRQYPEHRDRVFLLPLFAAASKRARGYLRYTIVDPYGKPTQEFESCYFRIEAALEGLLTAMFGGTPWRRS